MHKGCRISHMYCFLGRVLSGLYLLVLALGSMPYMQATAQQTISFSQTALQLKEQLRTKSSGFQGKPAAPHYDLIALRVEFRPDTSRFTTGDGTFSGQLFDESLEPNVDPLPHDASYFEAHLAFLENYVARVSGGRTEITTHLLPEVIQVSRQMGAYSPTGPDASDETQQAKLAGLVEEAWQIADQSLNFDVSGFDPDRTAFLLFHAGVGRDIELVGTTLEKTPEDLPSIFFDQEALDRLVGSSIKFKELAVSNTLILPRTETRQGTNFIEDKPFLLELSTNGLLAASFFNYLGVPDLFNTQTGEPAIGPFGLMDPLGIFAYNGLFSPEPTAWTKSFLGWTTPRELQGTGPKSVSLRAAGTGDSSDVALVPVSSAEYFLIENRDRDPEGDGLVLQVWKDGELLEQRVQNGDDEFNRFNVDGFIGGVVVAVDHYDWALPGGIDSDENVRNGGILIWHVVERRFEDGSVNADAERRALDLEEADSAQDIGFASNSPFGPDASVGTPFDYYYEGNPVLAITATGQEVRLYENRFGPTTHPDSRSNEGGESFITIESFSEAGAEMSFTYRLEGRSGISPHLPFEGASDLAHTTLRGSYLKSWGGSGVEGLVFRENRGDLFIVRQNTTIRQSYDLVVSPLVMDNGDVFFLRRQGDEHALSMLGADGTISHRVFAMPPGSELDDDRSLLMRDAATGIFYAFLAGGEQGTLLRFEDLESEPVIVSLDPVEEPLSVALDTQGHLIVVGRNQAAIIGANETWSVGLGEGDKIGQIVFGADKGGTFGVVPVINRAQLLLLRSGGSVQHVDLNAYPNQNDAQGSTSPYPILADLDQDGLFDVVTSQGRALLAFSQNGALFNDMPIELSAPAVAQPLIAERNDSGDPVILVGSGDGYIYGFDLQERGRQLSGFPLAVGFEVVATPLLQGNTLLAVANNGPVSAWTIESLREASWSQHFGNANNTSFVDLTGDDPPPVSAQGKLLVEAETYNWPNPIRGGLTYLRCMTTRDAQVKVTIINEAGSLIDELAFDLRGGSPGEHAWQTDAASGLYFARVTATTVDGQQESKLIKMAIIR